MLHKVSSQVSSSLNQIQGRGNQIPLKISTGRHYVTLSATANQLEQVDLNPLTNTKPNFGTLVSRAISSVNEDLVVSDQLMQQFITRPDRLNVHDVMIATEKAQLALELTKSVLQRATTSYQGLLNMR